MANNITFGSLSRVRAGEAKVYKNLKTGFAFEMEGDGKFEPSVGAHLEDAFGSALALDQVDDLKSFLKKTAAMEAQARPEPDAARMEDEEHAAKKTAMADSLTEMAESNLGPGWSVSESALSYNRYGGINRFEAERSKGGVSQSVYVEPGRGGLQVKFESEVPGERGKSTGVSQRLEFKAELESGAIVADSLQESASFQFPS